MVPFPGVTVEKLCSGISIVLKVKVCVTSYRPSFEAIKRPNLKGVVAKGDIAGPF